MRDLLDKLPWEHRPWPVPERRWALRMRWSDLLFLHWPIAASELRPHVPAELEIDTHDGTAWIGVVPFRMSRVRPRGTPVLPGLSAFPELNLRTYVTAGGKAGVWFLSLDVTQPLAVVIARRFFHLPYHRARMKLELDEHGFRYRSTRVAAREAFAFEGRYRPCAAVARAPSDSLEAWLTERYCLYSADGRGRVYRGDVHHERWPLQRAECEIERNTLTDAFGLELPACEPLTHFAAELDVVAWTLEELR